MIKLVTKCIMHLRQTTTLVALAAAVGLLSTTVILPQPAYADRGTEWEPGGILYKFRYKYGQKERPNVRTTNLGGIEAEDRGDEPRQRRRTRRSKPAAKRHTYRRRAAVRQRQRSHRQRVRVASLGRFDVPSSRSKSRSRSITGGGGVIWVARQGCLNGRLRAAIHHVARNYGRVRVNSTCRSRRHNRRVGGASRSYHLTGDAADIRIWGNVRGAARYLRTVVGGYKHYGGGLFHIDTGPRRSW